jgi:phosphatidylglycerophosphate synthase
VRASDSTSEAAAALPGRTVNWEQLKADYRTMAKPRAIEEVGDIYLIRPLGFLLVQAFRRTPLSPTGVSVLAVLAGWWSAWLFFASGSRGMVPSVAILGALALLLHSALDSADGQLARLKNMHTPLGRIIDGFCDNLSFLAIYVAVIFGYQARSAEHHAALALLGVLAGVSHSVQSSLVEYQRTLYLHEVHGRGEIVDSRPARLKRAAAPSLGSALLQQLHTAYYRQQRFILSSTAWLERVIARWRKQHPSALPALAARYEARHRPLLPYWALLASNSHKVGIIAAALVPVGAGSFWAGLGSGWYFIYVLALNLPLLVLVAVQGRVNRAFAAELATLAADDRGPAAPGR